MKITKQDEWKRVLVELANEDLKPAVYDRPLVELMGQVENKKILDYGAGPGVLARTLQVLGADVFCFDISQEMCEAATEKIGSDRVFYEIEDIPSGAFDLVVCNLVLCIVKEDEVRRVLQNIRRVLKPRGRVLVGFCNPLIHNVRESQLDFRDQDGLGYHVPRTYWKTKKEGEYRIVEIHRPISWYTMQFEEAGLKLWGIHFTPEYEFGGRRLSDFIIFDLSI